MKVIKGLYSIYNSQVVNFMEILRQLGLSAYEATVYSTLLDIGVAEARAIYAKANVPYGKVYTILNTLSEKGLVDIQESRPKKFLPIEPVLGLNRLLELKKSHFDKNYNQLLNAVSEFEKQFIRKKNPVDSDSSFWKVAVGYEDVKRLIMQKISEAQKEILFFTEIGKEDVNPNEFTNAALIALLNATKRGVVVKILLHVEDVSTAHQILENHGITKELLKSIMGNLEVRFTSDLVSPFDVIDGKRVTIKVQNPLDHQDLFAAIVVWEDTLAKELKRKFEMLWENRSERLQ